MRKSILVLIAIVFLSACGSSSASFEIVEKEYNDNGGKSTIRIVMEDPNEEDIENIIEDMYTDEFFGSASIHAWIHEPSENNDFGALVATAKYARSDQGKAQLGVDETNKVYVEFE